MTTTRKISVASKATKRGFSPTPAKTAEPSSLQDTYAAGQTIPGDEMEKLLLQYTRAKEKLSTLERLYPGGGE